MTGVRDAVTTSTLDPHPSTLRCCFGVLHVDSLRHPPTPIPRGRPMQLKQLSTALVAAVAIAASAGAQTTTSMGTGKGGSPHEKTMWHVGNAMITIEYGRPFLKGRPEAQMMPVGQPWRTGADVATIITS